MQEQSELIQRLNSEVEEMRTTCTRLGEIISAIRVQQNQGRLMEEQKMDLRHQVNEAKRRAQEDEVTSLALADANRKLQMLKNECESAQTSKRCIEERLTFVIKQMTEIHSEQCADNDRAVRF